MSSFSFYIPRVSARTSESDVIRAFTTIGLVNRIDFTPLGKQHGFKENANVTVKSAFVHMAELFEHGKEIVDTIQSGRSYKIFPYLTSEFWLFLEAKNPIQYTMMNTSQIVDNCRYLENKVEQQAAQLEQQAADIRALTEKLEGVHSVVYQLVGGLYCQHSQVQAMTSHLNDLFPEDYTNRSRFEEPDDSKWSIWPTTRQGDNCERRISELEKDLESAIAAINQHAGKGEAQDKKISTLEQHVKELAFDPVFTAYDYEEKPMSMSEIDPKEYQDQEEDQDPTEDQDQEEDQDPRRFVPIPMEQLIEQHKYNESRSNSSTHSNSTHSSMPDLIYDWILDVSSDSSVPDLESITDDDDIELSCFKTRGELNRLYNSSRHPEYDSESEVEVGF